MSDWPANPPKSASDQWVLAQTAKARAVEPPQKNMEGTAGEFNRAHDNIEKPRVVHIEPLTRAGAQPVPGLNYNPPQMNRGISQEPLDKLHAEVKARNQSLEKDSAKLNNSLGLEHGNNDRDDRSK